MDTPVGIVTFDNPDNAKFLAFLHSRLPGPCGVRKHNSERILSSTICQASPQGGCGSMMTPFGLVLSN